MLVAVVMFFAIGLAVMVGWMAARELRRTQVFLWLPGYLSQKQHNRCAQRFGDHVDYRWKVTYMVLVGIALQEMVFAVYKLFTRKYYILLRGLSAIVWVVLGLFLVVIRVRLI